MKRQAIAAAIGLAAVVCVALGVVIWFTLNSSGTGTASAAGTCSTVLIEDVSAGERWISVADLTDCDVGIWIWINPGTGTEEYHRVETTGSFNELKLATALAFDHSVGEQVEEVLCVEPISPGIHCGTYGALEPWPDAGLTLNPDSGRAGSATEVELANIRANGACQQHAEVLWGWSPSGGGEEIGGGYVGAGATSLTLDAAVPEDAGPGEGSVTACWWHFLDYTWYYKEAQFDVTGPEESPTPTPTPTPGPTATPVPPPEGPSVTPIQLPCPVADTCPIGSLPEPLPSPITVEQVDNCPEAGTWAMAVWEGSDGTDPDEALATCGQGALDVAYTLDPGTGQWLRWFAGRPEISTLTALENMQGFLALGSSTANPSAIAPIPLPLPIEMGPGQMRGCPLPGKWSLAVWQGPDGGEVGAAMDTGSDRDEFRAAMDTCGVWQIDAAYGFDPVTGVWARWFRDRPEISTLDGVQFLGTFLVLGKVPGGGGPVVKPEVGDLLAYDTNAFVQPGHIYVIYENGAGQTMITNNAKSDRDPDWSPDGTRIAFSSNRGGNFDIYTMYPNGTFFANVTNTPDCDEYEPAWSPDGSKIAFTQICFDWSNPRFHIVATGANGGGETWWLKPEDAHVMGPTWSPDGSWIAYQFQWISYWQSKYGWEIMKVKSDGSGTALLAGGLGHERYPSWSPDGSKILYTSNQDGDYEIYTMNPDGTGQTYFFDDPGWDSEPSWSHDGSKIAFVSNRDGDFDIYVMKADGTGLKGLNVVGSHPDWR